MCLHGDFKKAAGDRALAKIIKKDHLSTLFLFNFILNAELYVSIFLITQILQQGILSWYFIVI